MGPNVDKLFLEIAGKPVVLHTWQKFDSVPGVDEIVVVVRESLQKDFEDMAQQFQMQKPFRLVSGGQERQDSVWNGLDAVSADTEVVAIHDGARPCTSEAVIEATIEIARECGAAVAAQPVTDTIKESADGKTVQRTVDRARLWAVQTPQTFRIEIIRHALQEVRKKGLHITDDTAACELIGQPVQLVSSALPNPKVTRPEDLFYIEALLRNRASRLS